MKKKILSFTLALVFIFSALALTACGDEDEIVTEVRFTAYDNGDGDMISFYMTSDTKPYGVWEYTIEKDEIFDIFMDSEEVNDYGLFGWGGKASYRTLILKPAAEGETTVSFKLTEGSMTYKFLVNVKKDGKTFKIEAKEI